MKIKRC